MTHHERVTLQRHPKLRVVARIGSYYLMIVSPGHWMSQDRVLCTIKWYATVTRVLTCSFSPIRRSIIVASSTVLSDEEKLARFVTLQETCKQQLAATDAITIRLGYMPIDLTRVNIAPMKSFIKTNHFPTAQAPLSTMKKLELAAAVKALIATPPAAGFLSAPAAEIIPSAIVDAAAAVAGHRSEVPEAAILAAWRRLRLDGHGVDTFHEM